VPFVEDLEGSVVMHEAFGASRVCEPLRVVVQVHDQLARDARAAVLFRRP
jgi:hypothetical protein